MSYKIPKYVQKAIDKETYYGNDNFIADVKRYIKACKEHRLICSIDTVSASGMSRTMKFMEHSFDRKLKRGYILNFYMLFKVLGHQKVKDSDYFRITGCGMDMVFNTNYNNIREFKYMGFLQDKTARVLEQNTPAVI